MMSAPPLFALMDVLGYGCVTVCAPCLFLCLFPCLFLCLFGSLQYVPMYIRILNIILLLQYYYIGSIQIVAPQPRPPPVPLNKRVGDGLRSWLWLPLS